MYFILIIVRNNRNLREEIVPLVNTNNSEKTNFFLRRNLVQIIRVLSLTFFSVCNHSLFESLRVFKFVCVCVCVY